MFRVRRQRVYPQAETLSYFWRPPMIKVSVDVDGTMHSAEISPETHVFLRDGACLRKRPIHYFLYRVVKEYGSLTEENILKFMDEKWVL